MLKPSDDPTATEDWKGLRELDRAIAEDRLTAYPLPTRATRPGLVVLGCLAAGDLAGSGAGLALEVRRRVKEQQKRIGSAEFRNTQFSYVMGLDGVEKYVATPELQSEDSIGSDPLPPGQVWAISPGGQDEAIGLFRIEVTENSGSGVRILNQSPPAPFKESVKIAEQNLYTRSRELVGDRNPKEHEFAVQIRSFDAAKNGSQVGVAALNPSTYSCAGRHLPSSRLAGIQTSMMACDRTYVRSSKRVC